MESTGAGKCTLPRCTEPTGRIQESHGIDGIVPSTVNGSGNHAVSTNRRTKVPLPVRVASPEAGVSIKTYALLDITLCDAWLMKALRIQGQRGTMSLATLYGVQSRAPTKVMRLVGTNPTE